MRSRWSAISTARARLEFDHLDLYAGVPAFELAGDVEPDVSAAGDDDPARRHLHLAEDLECSRDLIGGRDDVDVVALENLVVAVRHQQAALTLHRDHDRRQVGKQLGKLAQRRIDHRAVAVAGEPDRRHGAVGKADGVECARQRQPPQHHLADLALR